MIAYHLNLRGARGGMLGVGVFFTLSGYLITDLLLSHWRRNGNLGLRNFWLRRARRLLPALFLTLAAVSVWVALFDASQLGAVRHQVFAASLYFSNWWTIAQHGSYFARFATPLPLDHLWSLAIEEQFYVVWPLLVAAVIAIARRPVRARTRTGEEHGCVGAAEGEVVRQGDVDRHLARHVRDVVEVARRVRVVVVDRRRRLAVDDRLDGEDGLDGARGAEAVAGRALRRRDGELARMLLAEGKLDHAGLGRVAEGRRGRVRVDVAHLRRIDIGVCERHRHRTCRIRAGRVGLRHVRRVG